MLRVSLIVLLAMFSVTDGFAEERDIDMPIANAVAAIAKEAGFSISAEDLTKAQSEVSDDELEAAAGGCIIEFLSLCSKTHNVLC